MEQMSIYFKKYLNMKWIYLEELGGKSDIRFRFTGSFFCVCSHSPYNDSNRYHFFWLTIVHFTGNQLTSPLPSLILLEWKSQASSLGGLYYLTPCKLVGPGHMAFMCSQRNAP